MGDNTGDRFSSAHFPSSPPYNPRFYAVSPRSSEPPTSPPMFSSDDAPEEADISNYESPRQKRKYAGTWWTSDIDTTPAPRKRTKLSREIGFDSGVWMMGSDDGSDEDTLLDNDANTSILRETLDEQIKRVTKGMSDGEAVLYRKVYNGIEQNQVVYILGDMELQDFELRHLGELNQVIQPPPDPGADVPDERAYRSMVPELYINLYGNHLKRLSTSLFGLQHLTRLVLRGNDIEEFPSQVRQLQSLTELDLSFNNIKALPSEILRLLAPHGKLKELLLFNNPLLRKKHNTSFLEHCLRRHLSTLPETYDPEIRMGRILEYLNGHLIPSAQEMNIGESMVAPIYEVIKYYTMELFGFDSLEAHHRLPPPSEFPGERRVLTASTAITYYDAVGRLLHGSPSLPRHKQDFHNYIMRFKSPPNSKLPISYGGPATWFERPSPSKPATLFSLSFVKALQSEPLQRIEEMLQDGDEMPLQVELYLQRAKENVDTQFEPLRTCYCCGKNYTFVRAEWIEFWGGRYDTGTSVQSESIGNEKVVPFKVQVCSWGCVPDELAAKP